jgi:trehalose 6-phosphate phosphatase
VPGDPLTNIEPLGALLSVRPLGLFSDIDGTLAPIVLRPEDARITPRCRELLQRLIERGVRLALITGRPLDEARSMAGLDEAAYAANHGLEYWVKGRIELADGVDGYPPLVDQIVAEMTHLMAEGVEVEPKGPGVAFHYRRAADADHARAAILRAIDSSMSARRFTMSEGRKVIELRPDVRANKGIATHILARQLGVKGIISIGDDRTDIDMFKAVTSLGKTGIEGRNVAVRSAEIVPEVLAAADYSVEGVEGVEWLLGDVLRAVGGTSP